MTAIAFRAGAPVTSIHPFTAAFNSAAPSSASALASLLAGQNIGSAANDPYGDSETNNGGTPLVSGALPMYSARIVPPASTQACVSNTAGGDNKLGGYAYVRFTAPASRDYQFAVGAPAGAKADFDIYRGGLITRSSDKVSLGAGDYVLAVSDLNNSGPSTCFTVSIQ